jgi:hypothetical protein
MISPSEIPVCSAMAGKDCTPPGQPWELGVGICQSKAGSLTPNLKTAVCHCPSYGPSPDNPNGPNVGQNCKWDVIPDQVNATLNYSSQVSY